MSRNDDYTTGNLLDDFYPPKYFKLIGIDLPRKTNISLCGQINFVKILKKMIVQQCVLLLKSSKKLF